MNINTFFGGMRDICWEMEAAAAAAAAVQAVCELINLCFYECDLRATVERTLSIFVPEKWDACQHGKAVSVDSETNCCIHCTELLRGNY